MADLTEPSLEGQPRLERVETVLIVEDDPGLGRLESLHIRRAGFATELATSAEAAMRAIDRGEVDLIVLDQNLQGSLSGLEFYEQLRASGNNTPAILVTGLSDEQTLIRAVRGGLSDFVPKVSDFLEDLVPAVERVITQVRTRRRLAESEERLADVSLLAQAIPQIVWSARPDGWVNFFNGRWTETTGLTLEQSEGWNWGRALHPDDLDRIAGRWNQSLESGTVFEGEYRFRRVSDGTYRWFLCRGVPVRDDLGRILKWFGTCTDIDDQKRSEEELKTAKHEAETASRAKDQFLAMLSHELRTPLTPVLLMATAARDDPETPEPLRIVFEEMRHNLELEARLIDDLLDVMRIISGKMPYQFEVVDAHLQILRALEICRADAGLKQLRVDRDLAATEHHVNADVARLQQVLWNLIKNAVKFTPEQGSITIRTWNEGPLLCIGVTDSGIGIEPTHLAYIFNAFEQGETAITKRFGGLGLGLAISRSIAEGHGGTLSASSQGRDQGATFMLSMPTDVPTRIEVAPSDPAVDFSIDSSEIRVLLVEDDVMTARIMAKLLRQKGYCITTANNVAQALQVPSDDYDLVVSDIGLPDGTGLELIQAIRLRHPVPGIALTGFGMEEDIRKSREAGFVAHMTKPLDFAKLEAMIRQVATSARLAPPQAID